MESAAVGRLFVWRKDLVDRPETDVEGQREESERLKCSTLHRIGLPLQRVRYLSLLLTERGTSL